MKHPAGGKSANGDRSRMRAAGLRRVQLWLCDTRSPRFAAECRRQSLLASQHSQEADMVDVVEAGREEDGWTA